MEKISFEPNVPVRVALKFAEGKLCEGRFGDQMYYTFTDGRSAYLNMDVAAKINLLGLRINEPFEICKYWSGKRGEAPQWDVRRIDARATAGAGVSAPAPISAPIDDQRTTQVTPHQTGRPATGNGISKPNGNGSGDVSAALTPPPLKIQPIDDQRTPPPLKIPINRAAVAAVRMVQAAMRETGEQWSDSAKQDLASTILIQMGKEYWLAAPERTVLDAA
jgi:hypothetical protein